MYPVAEGQQEREELFHRRAWEDYSPKHLIEYVPPPIVKNIIGKSTYVHNCIANKNKSNIGHFENIYNGKVFNSAKYKIMKIMHASGVDFRRLTSFKNALFDSDELKDNHLVTLKVWNDVKNYEM
jgi:hypothetical protein